MTVTTKKLTFEECLAEGFYDAVQFRESDKIVSPTFPALELTAQQVLQGKR